MPQQILGLAGWLLLTFVAAGVGALASVRSEAFYQQLSRPDWAPPPTVFGPVWSVLYLLMGVAAWLVWRERGFSGARTALGLFLIQLLANALWTWLFFAWRQGALAFGEILVLWVLIVATLVAFWRVRRLAALLLLPYLAWVSFAAALTYAVWRRNPVLLG
jgi:translocator protein